MVYNPTYSTSIFESIGIISGFNIAETIWEKYEKFAIPKIKESTLKLRGSLFYIKDLTPEQAADEVNYTRSLIPILTKLRTVIESNNDNRFSEFKMVAIDFLDTVDLLIANLQDIADIHSSFDYSKQVLATDWDRVEDDHWDNY